MNPLTLDKQLQALYEAHQTKPLQPGEFTVNTFQRLNNCTRSVAERLLADLAGKGEIELAGERLHEGKRVKAYRLPKTG